MTEDKRFVVGDSVEEFEERFRRTTNPALRRAEKAVIGADYGAIAFTTREQADLLGRLLELGPETTLLDIGSGAGWPGTYLAATTGCRIVVTDVPREGLRLATERMDADGVEGSAVVSAGEALPLRDETFDAVVNTDVFC